MEPLFRINPQLDPDQLNAHYRAKRRLHISDFLVLEHAERLLQFLKNSTAWHLVLNSSSKVFELDRDTQAALTSEQRSQLEQAAFADPRARRADRAGTGGRSASAGGRPIAAILRGRAPERAGQRAPVRRPAPCRAAPRR